MTLPNKIRVLQLTAHGNSIIHNIENDLTPLQELVGGYLELFPLPLALQERNLVGLCDGDGRLKPNAIFNIYSIPLHIELVGNVLILRSFPPEFVSLTDDDLYAISEVLEDHT